MFCISTSQSQEPRKVLSMDDVIKLAQENSISSMSNRNIFAAAYWSFRSYKADRLPSLNLSAGLGKFGRYLVSLQDAQTGAVYYRENYTLRNDLTLSIKQKISGTGGTLSLYTSLERLDQYAPTRYTTYYAQPVSLSYVQPLWGFNSFKWSKRIEPHNFEAARREYLENMESVTITAVSYFWGLALEQLNYEIAQKNYRNSVLLYKNAKQRFLLGTVTKDQVLQLELKMLNDSLAINDSYLSLTSQRNKLCSYIGYKEGTEIQLVVNYVIPSLQMSYDQVLALALDNSSFDISQKISMLEAERSVAQAKASRGLSASITATYGLSNSDDDFIKAYTGVRDQEVIGLSLSVPILDWGVGKGSVKMAQYRAETTRNSLEQARIDYEQDLMVQVMRFNNQKSQCDISGRAKEIAEQSYNLMLENFSAGKVSVTELNTSQSDKDAAMRAYLSNVRYFWNYYFNLRKATLYDFMSGVNITAQFDKLVE